MCFRKAHSERAQRAHAQAAHHLCNQRFDHSWLDRVGQDIIYGDRFEAMEGIYSGYAVADVSARACGIRSIARSFPFPVIVAFFLGPRDG